MEMATFTADWLHCHQLSNYVAQMVSHGRRDPVRHSNLLSSALNELLEMSFHSNGQHGEFTCVFYRAQHIERIELTFPCEEKQRRSYNELVLGLQHDLALTSYLDVIANDTAAIEEAILLGLIVNYDADIEVRDDGADALKLVVDLPLERLLN
jgi:hypothetical protein